MNGTAGGSKTTLYVKDATSPEVSFVITNLKVSFVFTCINETSVP